MIATARTKETWKNTKGARKQAVATTKEGAKGAAEKMKGWGQGSQGGLYCLLPRSGEDSY